MYGNDNIGDADYKNIKCAPFCAPYTKNTLWKFSKGCFSDPNRIQTCNLLIRSQMLYSVELWGRLQLCCYSFVLLLTITFFSLMRAFFPASALR